MGFVQILFPLALLGGLFFMMRSQKKQQSERQNLLDSMKIGDKVVTIGGLHGVISEINDKKRTVFIDCEGIVLEFERAAIRTVKPGTDAAEKTETIVEETTEEISDTDETKE